MNKWVELLLGLILLIAAVIVAFYSRGLSTWNFWSPAWAFLKGAVFWMVAMLGILFILLGISDLKG